MDRPEDLAETARVEAAKHPIDYNNLPVDPEQLYRILMQFPLKAEELPYGPTDAAILAPTWGTEYGLAVWAVIVPGERRAYKVLLNRANLIDLQKTITVLLDRPDLVAPTEDTSA